MAQATTQALLDSIAETIKDYRQGEILQPTAAHVAKWVRQFDAGQQDPILTEMHVLLKQTYINKVTMEGFLVKLVSNPRLAGADPAQFWPTFNFLDIQDGGSSQHEMLGMFSTAIKAKLGIEVDQCGSKGGPYVYLDDISFTGNRVLNDLNKWIQDDAPPKALVHVIIGALHSGGQWYANKGLQETAAKAKKAVSLTWWRAMELEDRANSNNTSDVFRPSSLPTDAAMAKYVKELAYPPPLRDAGKMGSCQVFATKEKGPSTPIVGLETRTAQTRVRQFLRGSRKSLSDIFPSSPSCRSLPAAAPSCLQLSGAGRRAGKCGMNLRPAPAPSHAPPGASPPVPARRHPRGNTHASH